MLHVAFFSLPLCGFPSKAQLQSGKWGQELPGEKEKEPNPLMASLKYKKELL